MMTFLHWLHGFSLLMLIACDSMILSSVKSSFRICQFLPKNQLQNSIVCLFVSCWGLSWPILIRSSSRGASPSCATNSIVIIVFIIILILGAAAEEPPQAAPPTASSWSSPSSSLRSSSSSSPSSSWSGAAADEPPQAAPPTASSRPPTRGKTPLHERSSFFFLMINMIGQDHHHLYHTHPLAGRHHCIKGHAVFTIIILILVLTRILNHHHLLLH